MRAPPPAAPLRLGALAPLTSPGWVDAGRHLAAGMALAAADANDAGGIHGRRLELVQTDTAGDPIRAAAAVDTLAKAGVTALVGEYHSVVAQAVAGRADALGVPFLCASAVLDALTAHATDWVARLSPPQSRGWRVYGDFLRHGGHRRMVIAAEPSVYWEAGTRILREHLASHGGAVVDCDLRQASPEAVCDLVARHRATAVVLLAGAPSVAVSLVRAVRGDRRLRDVVIGAPAGQPELAAWAVALGADAAALPFLRYLPAALTPLGDRVTDTLRERLGEAPSFVALEGYDAVAILAHALRAHGADRARLAAAWPTVHVEGTRGPIRFRRPAGSRVWQWDEAPIQVADRDPADPSQVRTLYAPPS